MATSTRGSPSSGKEKRGMSLSPTIKKTPKPLSSPSSPSDDKTNSPSNSGKSVPSYLRSTKSSSLDPNKQPKKPNTDAAVSKPTYTRRRSFDRPPPSSQVQKAIRGGSTSGASGSPDIKTQRSSSFSHKSTTSTSPRPSSEKLYARTSSLKDGKGEPSLSKSRSVKKSNLSPSTKKEPTATYRKKAPMSVASDTNEDNQNQPSVDHLTTEDDLASPDEHDVQYHPEMSAMPEDIMELADPANVKEEEDPKESIIEDVHDDDEEKSLIGDQASVETELADSQPVVQESSDVEATEEELDEATGDQHIEAQEKATEVDPTNAMIEDEIKEEERVPLETEAEKEEVEPTEVKDEIQTVSSPAIDSATPKTPQPSSAGKRDKQDYNDVIEETATKLLTSKKSSKVLALAGAFETVISLEGNNKS